jgi:hypothetical protein
MQGNRCDYLTWKDSELDTNDGAEHRPPHTSTERPADIQADKSGGNYDSGVKLNSDRRESPAG